MDRKYSAHSIAFGFAVGTFIGIIPTPGFGALLGVVTVFCFKQINKVSVFFGLAFWNYFILTPIYYLSYRIGDFLFASSPVVKYRIEWFNQAFNFSRRFLVGNLILAVTLSVISYFLVKIAVQVYRQPQPRDAPESQ